ncbi:MAG: AbrB/MazE/SpoVT family DNA-binding domain-containing protein [Dehalococcoidia bacterium]
MLTKIRKWGNSLALRIPKSLAEEAQVKPDSTVDLSLKDGTLVIRPIEEPKYRLDELLLRITPENLHGEVSTGGPVGREAP